MMKARGMLLKGSSQGLGAVIRADTTVNFLADRQQTIDVAPVGRASTLGYVWKRVFARRGGARA